MNNVDLTIIMPTWNKEKYIRDALDSIFAQKTRFSYHIVVADDHSTDGTLDIVYEYRQKHPDNFTVLQSEQNQKLYRNVVRAYAITKTPYFCVLDPDDYWTSERHIENALSYLELHKDFTVYSSGIEMLTPDGIRTKCNFAETPTISSFGDYLRGTAVIAYTQSCVFRNVVFANGVPEKMINLESPSNERSFRADSFRNFIHIREGNAYFNPDIESVYRLTNDGIYAGADETQRYLLNARLFVDLWQYDDRRHPELLLKSKRLFDFIFPELLKHWASVKCNVERREREIKECAMLEMLYEKEKKNISKALWKSLPPHRKIYLWGAMKLKNKGII